MFFNVVFGSALPANIHGISPVICLGGNRAKKRCPIALIDGIQSPTGQGAWSSLGKDIQGSEAPVDQMGKGLPYHLKQI